MTQAPQYDDLERDARLGLPHSWGHLDPNIGTMSQVTREAVLLAVETVAQGESISLNLGLAEIDPPLFGRAKWQHTVLPTDRNTFDDELTGFNPQSSSQWDGFRHVRAAERGFYGGITDLDAAGDALGIEHLAEKGVVGRGLLVDFAAWAQRHDRAHDALGASPISCEDLAAVLEEQGVEPRAGDILCIRTGWVEAYRRLTPMQRCDDMLSKTFTGLRADEPMARFLWDLHPGAVAIDSPGFEWAPGSVADGLLHRRLLPLLGVVMGELLDLEKLSRRCAELNRYEFLFVAAPLPVPGGRSSPSNALAIL